MLTIKWIKTFFIFLCVVLLLGGSEAFGSITSTPNMIRMEVYLSQDGQLINGSRAVELELHETQADNTPLFTKNMGSINFVDGYAALMFDIPTRDIKHLEGPEKKLFIINVQKGDMSSGFDRIKMDVLSTLKSKTSESAESVNWNNITNFPCSILSSFSDLHPDCADSSSNLGAASGPSSVFGLQVDNTTGFVGVGIIPQTELHINGTITNVDMPMTPTTSVNHIVLTLENDQFKKVDLSQDANKYPRVDAAGSGIEYVNAADISIGNADLLDGVDSTSFLKYSEPLTITNNFTVTNNSELYVNKININQIVVF